MGLELMTPRSRVTCSSDGPSQAPLNLCSWVYLCPLYLYGTNLYNALLLCISSQLHIQFMLAAWNESLGEFTPQKLGIKACVTPSLLQHLTLPVFFTFANMTNQKWHLTFSLHFPDYSETEYLILILRNLIVFLVLVNRTLLLVYFLVDYCTGKLMIFKIRSLLLPAQIAYQLIFLEVLGNQIIYK